MKIAKAVFPAALLALVLACGYNTPASTPPAAGTMPAIGALVPSSTTAGTSLGTNGLMVTGTNFNSNATINWNGSALPTAYVSGSQLTATVPGADTAAAGTARVTVTNPGTVGGPYGGGTAAETSAPMTFTISSSN
jgi:trimeric autotransporter adhesin